MNFNTKLLDEQIDKAIKNRHSIVVGGRIESGKTRLLQRIMARHPMISYLSTEKDTCHEHPRAKRIDQLSAHQKMELQVEPLSKGYWVIGELRNNPHLLPADDAALNAILKNWPVLTTMHASDEEHIEEQFKQIEGSRKCILQPILFLFTRRTNGEHFASLAKRID